MGFDFNYKRIIIIIEPDDDALVSSNEDGSSVDFDVAPSDVAAPFDVDIGSFFDGVSVVS